MPFFSNKYFYSIFCAYYRLVCRERGNLRISFSLCTHSIPRERREADEDKRTQAEIMDLHVQCWAARCLKRRNDFCHLFVLFSTFSLLAGHAQVNHKQIPLQSSPHETHHWLFIRCDGPKCNRTQARCSACTSHTCVAELYLL